MEEKNEGKVKLNEEILTEDEFEEKKEELEKKPGVKVVEKGNNSFKVRIQG